MGTNFYLVSKQTPDYVMVEKYHLGKRSSGWMPHFQVVVINKYDFPTEWRIEDCVIDSVRKLEKFYSKYRDYFYLADEYGQSYSWRDFKSEFIDWTGGKHCEYPRNHRGHFSGVYFESDFKDEDGYDWCTYDFF